MAPQEAVLPSAPNSSHNQNPRSHLGVNKRIEELEENNFVLQHSVDDLENTVTKIQVMMSHQKPSFCQAQPQLKLQLGCAGSIFNLSGQPASRLE